jgi:hypothetical protein
VLLPPALLFYGRCWGRLAWLVLNVKRRKRGETPPPEAKHVKVHDPWALPREDPIPEVDVEVEPDPVPAVRDEWDEWRNPSPYSVAAGTEGEVAAQADPSPSKATANPQIFNHEQYYAEYRKREEERRARAEGRKPGQPHRRRATFGNAFGADLLPFFIQDRTIRAVFGVAILTLIVLVLMRVVLVTFRALLAG